MDKNIPIQMMLDNLIENGKILMCSVQLEESGSTLIKIRLENNDGDHSENNGEATQNSNVFFRRKNQKQMKRDIGRLKNHQGLPTSHKMNTRSQSSIEKPRCDISTPSSNAFIHEVPSPDSVINTPPAASPHSIDLQDQSPMPPDLINTENNHQSGDDTEYQCSSDSLIDSASVTPASSIENINEVKGASNILFDQVEPAISSVDHTPAVVGFVNHQSHVQYVESKEFVAELADIFRVYGGKTNKNSKRERDKNKSCDTT